MINVLKKLGGVLGSVFANTRMAAAFTAFSAAALLLGSMWINKQWEVWSLQRELTNNCTTMLEAAARDRIRIREVENENKDIIAEINSTDDIAAWAAALRRMQREADKRINTD